MYLSKAIDHKSEFLGIFLVPGCMAQTIPLHLAAEKQTVKIIHLLETS